MQSTTAVNQNVASPAQLVPVVVQSSYPHPGQPPAVPVIVYGSPYDAHGPGVPYVAQPPQNNNKKMWILAAVACCSFFLVLPGIIGILMITNTRHSHKTQTAVEGVMFGNQFGVFLVSLPSLEQKQISSEPAHSVAFDWNSRKVYWISRSPGATKRANLDGTDVEELNAGGADKLAVDWLTGNVYYLNFTYSPVTHDIRVCSSSGEKCSTFAFNQIKAAGISLHPSKGLMFWANLTSIVRAKMDGNAGRVILSRKVGHIAVDEDSDRLYWVDDGRNYIRSFDFNGNNEKVHLYDATGSLFGLAVHGDLIYFGNKTAESVKSVNKDGGNLAIITNTTGSVWDVALYGRKSHLPENPCENSPCEHLCVLHLQSYACSCPAGTRLDPDGVSCY